jgi:DNA-binding LacI/PurR family transcriptional regulator
VYVSNSPPPEQLIQEIQASNFPVVWLNHSLATNAVAPDNRQGSKMLTHHLIEKGHRKIAFVFFDRPNAHFSVAERMEGYLEAMKQANLTPYIHPMKSASAAGRRDELRRWIAGNKLPDQTGWICYGNNTARAFISLAREAGMKIPQEYSVATFGMEGDAWAGGVRITLAREPFEEIGRVTGEALMYLIHHPDAEWPSRRIPMTLVDPGETISSPSF